MGIHCLINPRAGLRRGDLVAQLARHFEAAGVRAVIETLGPGDRIEAGVQRALGEGAEVIAAGGGDGTVSSVAASIAGTGAALGVLPLGTLNHFARDLGVPLDLAQAVQLLCAGSTVTIDLGEVNGRVFLNNVSLGAYPDMVRMRERWRPRLGKWPAAAIASLIVLQRHHLEKLDVEIDGQRLRRYVPLLFVGNNDYEMSWPKAGSRARLDRATLTLAMIHHASRRAQWRSIANILSGRPEGAPHVESRSVREVCIRSQAARVTAAIDGELVHLDSPLWFRVRAAALRVRAPAPPAIPAPASPDPPPDGSHSPS